MKQSLPLSAQASDSLEIRPTGMTLAARIRSVFFRDVAATVGTLVTLGVLLFGLIGPFASSYDPIKVDMSQRLVPPGATHWLGSDEVGRDILTRIAHGTRYSLGTAVAIIVLATVAGFLVGGFSGYLGGRFDDVVMRICDLVMAFPHMILGMAIAFALGPGLVSTIIALGAVWWPSYARLVRGMVLSIKENLYVEAARAAGVPTPRIIIRHILPQTIPAMNARITTDVGVAMILSAGLSFIGLGAQAPVPEWGAMIASSREFAMNYWWTVTFPGLAIFAAALGISLVGDALQDALDPRLRGRF